VVGGNLTFAEEVRRGGYRATRGEKNVLKKGSHIERKGPGREETRRVCVCTKVGHTTYSTSATTSPFLRNGEGKA